MRKAGSALVQILVAFGVILSTTVIDASFATPPAPVRATIADQHDGAGITAHHPSPRAKRKQDRRQERHRHRAHERKRDRRQSDSERDRKRHEKQRKRNNIGRLCDDQIASNQSGPCTHGPDPAPPGFDVKQDVAPLTPSTAAAQAATVACEGDGQRGFRLQLLYVRAADVPSRFEQYRVSIQAWAAEADAIVHHSAAATGGERRIRFFHDADCLPIVRDVTISPQGAADFWQMIADLQAQGFDRPDRLYQAFIDANAYCGLGMIWNDDRADGTANRHNSGPGFSRIDSGCWGAPLPPMSCCTISAGCNSPLPTPAAASTASTSMT